MIAPFSMGSRASGRGVHSNCVGFAQQAASRTPNTQFCCPSRLSKVGSSRQHQDVQGQADAFGLDSNVTGLFSFVDVMSGKERKALHRQSARFGEPKEPNTQNPEPKPKSLDLVPVGQGTPSSARWPGTWKPLRGTDCTAWRRTYLISETSRTKSLTNTAGGRPESDFGD